MHDLDFKVTTRPGYVLVERTEGYKVVLGEQPEALTKISAACEKAGCRRVLIQGPRTRVRLSVADIYELGKQIAELGLLIAVVESHDVANENVEFLETVVSNRGAPIQFFDTTEAAEYWLGSA